MNGVNWQQHCVGTKLAMYLLIRRAGSRRVFEHFSMSNKARMARWAIYHKVTVLLFCWFVYIAIYLISIMNIELKGPAAYGTAPYALGLLLTRFCNGDAARSFRAALEACGCPSISIDVAPLSRPADCVCDPERQKMKRSHWGLRCALVS